MRRGSSGRVAAFVALSVACVLAATASVVVAVVGGRADRRAAERSVAAARPAVARTLAGGRPFVLFRSADRDHASTLGRMTVAAIRDGRPGRPRPAGPSCDRVAFAGGRGLCLEVTGASLRAAVLDARLGTVHELELPGIPSRARVSPDGRWGGVTAFLVGHGYAAPGAFSTAATIVDLSTGRIVGTLEQNFRVMVGERALTARDRNFWGLTFAADGDTFYATAASGGRTWLVKGSIRARTARAIHENVECPSLSPDGTRIGYKKAVGHDPTVWRFGVLDLATGRETPLAETRSIDDQLAWLDDGRLLYADTRGTTWVVRADGRGRPARWLRAADSATVGRGLRPPAT